MRSWLCENCPPWDCRYLRCRGLEASTLTSYSIQITLYLRKTKYIFKIKLRKTCRYMHTMVQYNEHERSKIKLDTKLKFCKLTLIKQRYQLTEKIIRGTSTEWTTWLVKQALDYKTVGRRCVCRDACSNKTE